MSDLVRKAGRPMIKLEDLPKDWDKKILALSNEGASIIELAVALGISRDTFYEMSKREPIFSDTIKGCKELSEAWWEKQGRTNLTNKEFNYTGWYMNMKNRHGWKDKSEVENTHHIVQPILGGESTKKVEAGDEPSTDD